MRVLFTDITWMVPTDCGGLQWAPCAISGLFSHCAEVEIFGTNDRLIGVFLVESSLVADIISGDYY